MSREVIDIIKAQLGLLMVEVAVLTSKLEQRDERVKELDAKVLELEQKLEFDKAQQAVPVASVQNLEVK